MGLFKRLLVFAGLDNLGFHKKIRTLEKENSELRKSLEKSRASGYYLHVAVKSNLDAIICVNSEGKIVLFNPAAEDLFQYSEQEVLNQPVEILLKDGAQDKHQKRLGDYLKDGVGRCDHINRRTERVFKRKDGTTFIGEHSLAAARAEDTIYLASTIKDLTKYKEREQRLRENQDRLELALESTNIGMWDHNLKTGEVYRTDKWAEMLGYKPDEIPGDSSTWKSLIHPEDKPVVDELAMKHESRKTETFAVEHRLKTKDGNYKWILNWGKIAEFDDEGNPVRALGTHIDIDERKRAEETLKIVHEQFASVMDSLDALIYVIDMATMEILFMNKKSKDIFGDCEGRKCKDVLYSGMSFPCDACPNYKLVDENGKPAEAYHFEYENENTGQWFEITDKAIYWPGEKIVKLEIAYDITERKKNEEVLRDLNATKDRLFSIIGHDLKNPLSDIIGFSELLRRNYTNYSSEKVMKFHELIYNSARTTNELLENLLEWSGFQSGKLSFQPGKTEIKSIVEGAIKIFRLKAKNKNISLLNGFDRNIEVFADKKMIETVIRNLLSNSIKFTEKEGTVNTYYEIQGDKLVIIIADNGKGISKVHVDQIFSKEKYLSTLGTSGEKGTGLGLIICKDFIEKHGESIWVESEPGEGSEFKFTLPLV